MILEVMQISNVLFCFSGNLCDLYLDLQVMGLSLACFFEVMQQVLLKI